MVDDDLDVLDIPNVDLQALGARALATAGNGRSLVIVSLPRKVADVMFPDGVEAAGHREVVEAVEHDLELLAERDRDLARGGLAMSALAMAWEVANPYTSATAKSMCAARLVEALERLRELAPPKEEKGKLYDLRAKLRAADSGGSTA